MNTPGDIVEYIMKENLESEFLLSVSRFKNNYTIGEIGDKNFVNEAGKVRFKSKGFNIDVSVEDDNVITAVMNKLYVSAFISRKESEYQLHFFVHRYPESMKEKFEENIVREVIEYMIFKTVIALRLDTVEKVNDYITK